MTVEGQRKVQARRERREGRGRDGNSAVKQVSGEGREGRAEGEGSSRNEAEKGEGGTDPISRQAAVRASQRWKEGGVPPRREGGHHTGGMGGGREDKYVIQGWRRSSAMQRTIIHVRSDRRTEGG